MPARRRLHAACAWTPAQELAEIQGRSEAGAKILTEAIKKTLQELKLQDNLKSRGYNIDLRTTTADLNKLVKEEIDKYARFTPQDLGWKAQ